jgi:hypothetical protein
MSESALAVMELSESQHGQKKTGDSVNLKRLNLNLAPKAYEEVQALAKETSRSMTELVRLGLGLVKIAFDAKKSLLKLAVVDSNGTPIREILIP